jgi:hypothetical protein
LIEQARAPFEKHAQEGYHDFDVWEGYRFVLGDGTIIGLEYQPETVAGL